MSDQAHPNLSGFEVFHPPFGSWALLLDLLEEDVENEEMGEWVWWLLGLEDWRG